MPDLSELKREAHHFGWPKAIYAFIMKRLGPALHLYTVHIRTLDTEPQKINSSAIVRVADPAEIYATAQRLPEFLQELFVDDALARGDVCIGAFIDGEMVSFVWRCYSNAPHFANIRVEVAPPYRFGYKSFTSPEFRGQRLMSLNASDPICIARGCTTAIAFIATHNYASIRTNLRAGNVAVGLAGHLTLFGRVFCFRSPGAKRYSFRFYVEED